MEQIAQAIALISGNQYNTTEEWRTFLRGLDDILTATLFDYLRHNGTPPTEEECNVIAAVKHLRQVVD